jgi:hypothetical protein
MAIKKADATTTNEIDLTSQDIIDFQDKFNIKDPRKIQSSIGFQVSVTGMTDIEKGTALQTAIDNTGGFGWVYVPPGTFDSDTGDTTTINQREFTLFSNGRSQSVIQNSYGYDALVLDATNNIIYRSTVMNLMCRTPMPSSNTTGDAIHIKGIGVTACRLLNMHVNQATRDAIHIDSSVNGISIDCQLTETYLSTGIGRYTVFADCQRAELQLSGGGGNQYYFGVNSLDNSIRETRNYANGFRGGLSGSAVLTDLGKNNKVISSEAFEPFRKSDKYNLLPLGGGFFPVSSALLHLPFNDFSGESIYNNSPTGYDGVLENGAFSLVSDDIYGKIINFDGATSFTIPNIGGVNLGDEFFIAFMVKYPAQVAAKNDISRGGGFELILENNQLEAFINFDMSGRTSRGVNLIPDVWQQVYLGYKNGKFFLGSINTNQYAESNVSNDNYTIGASGWEIGKRFANTFTGNLAHLVVIDNYNEDYILSHYNMAIKALNQSNGALDRGGRNAMTAPFNLSNFDDSTRPSTAEIGGTIFNTDDGQMNIWNGSNWTFPDGTIT